MIVQEDNYVIYVIFHDFINVKQIWNWLSCFINNEARASLIWEFINAFSRNNFNKFDMSVFLCDGWKMMIDQ